MSEKSKNICFFNTNRAWGGGEKWHLTTAKEMNRRGYHSIMVANNGSELYRKARIDKLLVYAFSVNNISFINPMKILTMVAFFKSKKIDAIILNLPQDLKLAGIAAKIAGIKTIIYRRGMPHPLRDTVLNRFLFKNILTHVVVNSEEIGRSLAEKNESWFPKEKLKLVYNGVTPPPQTHHEKIYKKESNEFVIGNAGRLTDQKGQIYLLDLAEQMKNDNISFRMLIAGEGELRSHLEKIITEKNLQTEVKLLGHVDDMMAFFNSLDLFIFPSKYEGAANTLIETIQHGVPCIAFDISSNPEIIQHNVNGYLAKPFEVSELKKYTYEVMNHPEKKETFRQANEKILSSKFDNHKNLTILEGIL
ncbi:MAG: glycosyltransferase [Bdellovibrionota bacterium]